MQENFGLLDAVLQSPDADAPRTVYADWCTDEVDPAARVRAEFIRLQLEMERPGALEPEMALRSSVRQRRLLSTWRDNWGEILGGRVGEFDFHRGFVELVVMSASEFLASARALFDVAPIRHLDITSLGDFPKRFFDSDLLSRIRSLSMERCRLSDRDIVWLTESPHVRELRWLAIGENFIRMPGAEALASARSTTLPKLQFVRLFGNPVDPTERYSHDQGAIVDRWLPPEGQQLEDVHGRIEWLHRPGASIEETSPNRFSLALNTDTEVA